MNRFAHQQVQGPMNPELFLLPVNVFEAQTLCCWFSVFSVAEVDLHQTHHALLIIGLLAPMWCSL